MSEKPKKYPFGLGTQFGWEMYEIKREFDRRKTRVWSRVWETTLKLVVNRVGIEYDELEILDDRFRRFMGRRIRVRRPLGGLRE